MIVQGTIFVTKGFPEFHSVRCCRFACRGHLAGVNGELFTNTQLGALSWRMFQFRRKE
jgi:hypothetical protein